MQDAPAAAPAAATSAAAAAASSPAPAPIPPRAPAELVPAAELVGGWRVAGVDGQPIDLPYAITASIDDRRILVVADCVNMAWTYAAEGAFEATRAPVESCGRGLTAQGAAIAEVLDTATGFGRTPSNAMEIFSVRRRVTLYPQ